MSVSLPKFFLLYVAALTNLPVSVQTGLCFITAHLAAGFANYDERNRDYRTISHGLRFQRNRSIDDHDTIIWLGDFNYRIGLTDEKVRRLIDAGDLEALYRNDQVSAPACPPKL